MTSASRVVFTCILIICTGVTRAEDRPLSDSSIIALSVLFGSILLILVFCLVCYCSRRYKYEQRRKNLQHLQSLKKSDPGDTEAHRTATVTEHTKEQDVVSGSTTDTNTVSQTITDVAYQRKLETIEEANTRVDDTVELNEVSNKAKTAQEKTELHLDITENSDDIERQVINSIYKHLLEDSVESHNEDLSESIVPESVTKTKSETETMVVVQNNTVYTQARNAHYTHNGGGAPQVEKFTEWRAKTSAGPNTNMYVKNVNTATRNQYVDMRPRTRSISPTRYQQRTVERGRSSKRIVVPPQQVIVTPNTASTMRMETINRARVRSRSAPPLRETTYVTKAPPQTTGGYTQSHFLAIKRPFSKKFLLPPVKVSERFVPFGTQRVVVHKRQTVVPRPEPRPEPQKVYKGKVYHVQYSPEGGNTLARGVNAMNLDRSTRQTVNSGQVLYNGNQQYVTRSYSNTNSQGGLQGHAVYGQQLSYESDVFESNGMSSRPTSQVYETKTAVVTSTGGGEADYIYSQASNPQTVEVRTEEAVSTVHTNGNEDEYTIVDYVEGGSSTPNKAPLSTSTPRFPERDTSALEDLDNVLGKSGSSSSSSSSSSSNHGD